MPASTYTRANLNNAILRGIAFPIPTRVYISLHTANPGSTGASEVTNAAWPGYARKDSANGGAIATGWSADAGGISSNLIQQVFAPHDGVSPIGVSHWALWDALSGGNCLEVGSFDTPFTVNPGNTAVIGVSKLVSQVV